MTTSIALERITILVLRKQHLADDAKSDDIIQAVTDICGLHATGAKEPYLSLHNRMPSFVKEQLDDELYSTRNLIKVRCMRGTLHILTREIVPIAYTAMGDMIEKLSRRFAELRGISPEQYEEISLSVKAILKNREMSVSEIKRALGISHNISAILNLMCDQGILARVQPGQNWQSKKYTYALFNEYYAGVDLFTLSEPDGIKHLVLRYLQAFGPATENDITWWTGLIKTKVRRALSELKTQLSMCKIAGLAGDYISLCTDLERLNRSTPKSTVNMLPALDPYIMGYKERARYMDLAHYHYVFDRTGNATSTIVLDGKIVGVWDSLKDDRLRIKIFLFEKVTDDVLRDIYVKAQKIGQFVEDDMIVHVERLNEMVPLTERTAGGFMSPLKNANKC